MLLHLHILFYFFDPHLQQTIENYGWSGEIKKATWDYLMVVDTNIGGGKTDRVIKEKIDSIKYSKKKIRVNFKYSLKINNLSHSQQRSDQMGVGGGILEKDNQNFFSSCPSELVRKENFLRGQDSNLQPRA